MRKDSSRGPSRAGLYWCSFCSDGPWFLWCTSSLSSSPFPPADSLDSPCSTSSPVCSLSIHDHYYSTSSFIIHWNWPELATALQLSLSSKTKTKNKKRERERESLTAIDSDIPVHQYAYTVNTAADRDIYIAISLFSPSLSLSFRFRTIINPIKDDAPPDCWGWNWIREHYSLPSELSYWLSKIWFL